MRLENNAAIIEAADKAMKRLAISADDALSDPTSKAAKAFRTLGISMQDLKTLKASSLDLESLSRVIGFWL